MIERLISPLPISASIAKLENDLKTWNIIWFLFLLYFIVNKQNAMIVMCSLSQREL